MEKDSLNKDEDVLKSTVRKITKSYALPSLHLRLAVKLNKGDALNRTFYYIWALLNYLLHLSFFFFFFHSKVNWKYIVLFPGLPGVAHTKALYLVDQIN